MSIKTDWKIGLVQGKDLSFLADIEVMEIDLKEDKFEYAAEKVNNVWDKTMDLWEKREDTESVTLSRIKDNL